MKLFLVVLLMVFTNGCANDTASSPDATNPDIEGYITKTDNNRILVVSPAAQDFSSTGGLDEFYNAVWISNIPGEFKAGQKVKVWFDGAVAESYPAQAKAKKITRVPVEQPVGAKLTEEQVLQQALVSKDILNIGIPVIIAVEFDSSGAKWRVRIKDGMPTGEEAKEYSIEIADE